MWLYEIKHDGFRLIAQTVRTPPTLRGEAGGYDSWGISMGNTLHSILIRLVAYVAVVIAAGLLFLAGQRSMS